jgi:hypothetical protein
MGATLKTKNDARQALPSETGRTSPHASPRADQPVPVVGGVAGLRRASTTQVL